MGRTIRVLTLYGCVIGILLALTVRLTTAAEELFGYREDPEDNPGRQNANNRTPVYIPGRCGENEILYPGDQENDWVCDCRPAHVYHPISAGCFPLYTRAYCREDEYVEIKLGSKLPKCTKNICEKGHLPFNGLCVVLHKNNEGACPTVQHIRYVIGVNEVTLQLDCISRAPVDFKKIVKKRTEVDDPEIMVTKEGHVLVLTAVKGAVGSIAWLNATQLEDKEDAIEGTEAPL
ncbi:uncharacterized protein LOC135707961 [Ochlerotatus camptorhynchus]|uniref:uncharacterized protein LOC135707961 n=1 Tax=Ochlerotatus camptorhynchus TaxID=644619 RepID=UPI0031CE96E3